MVGPLVIDCSITMTWCFEDEKSDYTISALRAVPELGAIVPALWPYEVANALAMAERHNRISSADRTRFLDALDSLGVRVEPAFASVPADLIVLAQRHRLTVYDAAYLELARSRGLPLVTTDRELLDAAAAVGVGVFSGG